ncbi:MAG: patatin-like phospholipase family protein [Oleispira antarctica]|uniref:Patatin family protein n=1 Tax=Oleispira antarctica RB-8 TaxID=698738 RepID=R4YT61_OLEAN|nr:patatin-like phospholipase family protein [Oleispira antarctica]CCK75494.1 Patatin family protein [Oleispira antarctica RB-8]|tara:strand:- start:1525 stop:2490 length:966 start_codon:yes stop_codon:yes gene_type:complete
MSKTVALVLGSGGARGMAHIGIIEELEARGYEIISVSGCSMGSVIGGFYCAKKLDVFYQWAKSLSYMDLLRLVDFSFISNGAIRGDKVFSVLFEMLGDIQIEDLEIPFTAVATDLSNAKEVWFQRGSLEQAMRASVAIPGLLQPVKRNNSLFVDGGVLNPLPIAASVSAHADFIIAVDLNADVPIPKPVMIETTEDDQSLVNEGEDKSAWINTIVNKASNWLSHEGSSPINGENVKDKVQASTTNLGKLEILYQMFDVMQASLSQYKIAGYPPDLLVKIPKDSAEMYEFHRTEELVNMGRQIANDALDAFEQGHSSLYGQR